MLDSRFNLDGKYGLIVGLANNHSIAFGCFKACINAGSSLAVTYQSEKSKEYVDAAVAPWLSSRQLQALMVCDLNDVEQVQKLFLEIRNKMPRLDFLIHSVAFAPAADLKGRVIDCSANGFLEAMRVSCYSLIQLSKYAEPLMTAGGSIVTMSYYGSEKVIPNYNIMGPVKAALEATVRELASELGSARIRVNAISPGPIKTRAAGGLPDLEGLMADAVEKSPGHRLVTIDEVGALAAFMVSDAAMAITGTTTYVDAGYHIMA